MQVIVVTAFILVGLAGALALYSAYGVWRTERHYPPLGRFLEVDGIRLHFVEAGVGPPIVLLHGANTTLRDFAASILPLLARHHRVIAFDRPGYGYSERPSGAWPDPARQADILRRALALLGIERPILVGHSWSGAMVLAYLLDHAEHASAGVLLAGASHPWTGGVAWTRRVAGIPIVGELFARTIVYPVGRLLLRRVVAEVFAPDPVTPRYLERTGVVLALRPRSFLVDAQDVRELSEYLRRQSRRYHQIHLPLLLITGDADDVVPPWNHAKRLIEQAPYADLVVLDKAGHALHHSRPKDVADLIRAFAPETGHDGLGIPQHAENQ